MTSNEILKADMLDILFENRNKLYGAYTLRKYYNRRLIISLGLALSVVIFLFLYVFKVESNKSQSRIEYKIVEIGDAILPPPQQMKKPEVPQTRPSSTQKASQQAFIDKMKIVNKDVSRAMPIQSDLINISDFDSKGKNINIPFPPVIPGPQIGVNPVQHNQVAEPPIQREPEFPGGPDAWVKFLRDHLQAPGQLEIGEKKTVMIKFLVSVDGSVTGFEVLQSGGRIYDKEVIRVLKLMPRWKPAIQNNKPVSRSFTQPVTFMGLEE
jgi:periplasmic protein TonB